MKDDLRWNKIFGAVLGTLLFIFVLRQGAEMFFATTPPAKPGDAIAVQIASTDAAPVADTPPDWGTVLPTADVAAGATQSGKCLSCHNFANGGPNGTGPNNWGVIGRQPGTHPGFTYSQAMIDFGQKNPKWDYDHIYMFLGGPQAYVQGTKMSFVGIKAPQDRINLIAWLRQQSSSPVPIPAPNPKAAAAATPPSAPSAGTAGAPAPASPSDKPAAVTAAPAGGASGASTSVSSQTSDKAAASTSTEGGQNAKPK